MSEPSGLVDATAEIRRALVVDDDPDICRLLGFRLERRGFDVRTAGTAEEAIEEVDSEAPDLIFLDISMPGMGGLEALGVLRARDLDAAVVMTTAFGSEQVAIEALRSGADDYLRKPFDSADLQTVLARTTAHLALRRSNARLQRQLDRKRRQLETELANAADVQAGLLPADLPPIAGFELAGRCLPARHVGGDFYDWQVSGRYCAIAFGDVMGKGMPAALLSATVRSTLRALTWWHEPASALVRAACLLEDDLVRSERFVTLLLASLDGETGEVRYVDAGHGLAAVCRAGGTAERLVTAGPPVGVDGRSRYADSSVTLGPGDALVVYSDGLVDRHPGLADPGSAMVAEAARDVGSALVLVDRLTGGIAGQDDLEDDITVVVLRRQAGR